MMPERFPGQLPDAVKNHWADTLVPAQFRPYLRMARLDRPIGWWLLLLPCWWSSALAAAAAPATYPNFMHMALFLLGAVVMRGAGCTYNDILDRKLDANVERTRHRPLASGQVSIRQALLFMGLLCLIGLFVLLSFNAVTIATGFASIGLVLIYPLMKRIFWMPQLVLGLAFNWGALVGWTAYTGSISLAPLFLYIGGIFWTVGYDTIYALQDIEDDEIVGIKSSARLFGPHVIPATALCYAGATLFFALSLYTASTGLMAYIGLGAFSLHMAWQIIKLDPKNGSLCLDLFRSNRQGGLLFFAGILIASYWG